MAVSEDRLEAMRILLAVVDAGSISAGSRKLNAPLPSVSRKVAELERQLGANLIVRTSRNLQLTDAGRDYVDAARKIMADLDEAERRASGEYQTPKGVLTITMPIEYGSRYVLPVALSFMDKYPEVSLNLLSLDRTVDLVSEQVDIAIRLGDLADSAFHARQGRGFPPADLREPCLSQAAWHAGASRRSHRSRRDHLQQANILLDV